MALHALLFVLACSFLSAAPKAIWVWEPETHRLLEDRAYEAQVTSLLRTHGFGTLYLYAGDYRSRNPTLDGREAYQGLLRRLHEAGLRVEALLDSHPMKAWEFVLPEHDVQARAMLQQVLDYNLAVDGSARFDGVHFDIEPYALDSWNDATRASLSRMYLDRSRQWVAMARSAGKGFVIGAAIPFWYDSFKIEWNGVKKNMNAHVQDLYDYVALMDYRNHAKGQDGIIALALEEVAYGTAHRKKVVLGLETGDVEPVKLTFRHRGSDAMVIEMSATERAFASQTGFSGFAIHHLGTWMELIAKPSPLPAPIPPRP